MTTPPTGASLLFNATSEKGHIKRRKNGHYRMKLDGVESIDWFTDHPDRVEGSWKPQKMLRNWDQYFSSGEPNAQIAAETVAGRTNLTFTMSKPKITGKKISFNLKPISESGKDKITALTGKEIGSTSLFIDKTDSPIRVKIPTDYEDFFWTNSDVGRVPVQSGDPLGVALFYGSWNEFKQVMSTAELLPWVNSAGESGFVAA